MRKKNGFRKIHQFHCPIKNHNNSNKGIFTGPVWPIIQCCPDNLKLCNHLPQFLHFMRTSWIINIMKMMCFKDISMQQSSGRNIKYFAGSLFITYNFTWRENPLIDNEFALSWFFLMFFVSIDRKHIKNLNLGHQGA